MNLSNLYNNYFKWIFFKKEYNNINNLPYLNIILDGLICQEIVSCYYILLLNALSQKENSKIKLYIVIGDYKAKFHKNNRVFKKYFETEYIILDKKNNTHINDFQTIKDNLYNVFFEKNIYSGFLRVFEIGKIDKNNINYLKFYNNWENNFQTFNNLISNLSIKYCIITDSVYHHFGTIFKSALLNNIKTIVTIPYDNSGKIGGRIYSNIADYNLNIRNYVLSYTDETFDSLKFNIDNKLLNQFVENRITGKQNIFDGHYHKYTYKFDFKELDRKFNYKVNYQKKVLVASHLFWDDVNSSFSNIYEDYETWMSSTIKIATENKNVLWIFKAHPSEKHFGTRRSLSQLFKELLDKLPDNFILLEPDSNINTYQLINYSDTIITVRGSIGFEASMLGKPVLNAGTGPYTGLGFNFESNSIEDYENTLKNIHILPLRLNNEQIHNAKIAAYIYFVSKCPISELVQNINSFENLLSNYKITETITDEILSRVVDQIINNTNGDLL
jgi:hypothetical protein